MTIEALVGRRLMFGLPGPDLGEDDVRLFRETQAAGLMLYRRNFETPERLHRLLTGLEEALGRRLLVATDHEGGRVIMLGRAVTIFPDNLAAGTAGTPSLLFRKPGAIGIDVAPDGNRFLIVEPVERPGAQPMMVVLNWFTELREKMRGK